MQGPPIMNNESVKLARQLMGFNTGPAGAVPVVTGPNEVSEQQMAALANAQTTQPSATIGKDGVQQTPDLAAEYHKLMRRPLMYKREYLTRGHKRWDFTFSGNTNTPVTQIAPDEIPSGAGAFIQQVDIMQLGNGAAPDSVVFYVTDVGNSNGTPSQIYTSGVNQYTGGDRRSFILGGVRPMFTFANSISGHFYLVTMQWVEVSVVDVPEVDLAALFGKGGDHREFHYGIEEGQAPEPDSADAIYHSLEFGGTGQGDF